MKKWTIILITVILTSCKTSTQENVNTTESQVRIDTVHVGPSELNDICVFIDSSYYPEISGLTDTVFQRQLNEIYANNFHSYIDTIKSQSGGCIPWKDEDGKVNTDPYASVLCRFQVLGKCDSIVSIFQSGYDTPQGGGNAWQFYFDVLNCDVLNNKILTNKDLGIHQNKLNLVNDRIKAFFNKEYPDRQRIHYPFVKKEELNELKFGITQDSIVLILEAYPLEHFSHAIYKIPIEKRSIK